MTRNQRNRIYKRALNRIDVLHTCELAQGICGILTMIYPLVYKDGVLSVFPEFALFEPTEEDMEHPNTYWLFKVNPCDHPWFSDMKTRAIVMELCIQMTTNTSRKSKKIKK